MSVVPVSVNTPAERRLQKGEPMHCYMCVCVYMCVHTEYTHNYLTSITVPLYSNNKEPNCSLSPPPGLSTKKYNSTTDTVVQRV